MARQLTGPVIIATHNPGKLREMRELLAPYGIATQSTGELGFPEPEETERPLRRTRASRRLLQPALAESRRLQTTPDWSSMPLAASPASIPLVGPDPTRIFARR